MFNKFNDTTYVLSTPPPIPFQNKYNNNKKLQIHQTRFDCFLVHMSWKRNWAFLIACCPSSFCPPVCKLFTYSSSSPEPPGQFLPNLAHSILGWWGFKFVQMKDHALFQGEIITKIHWRNLKIFLRTTGPISTKLGTKHPWVKGIQVRTNEGPRPFQRGDNYKTAKIHWRNIEIFFCRIIGIISTKLGIKHS